ncbi:hypothetical protein SUGI_1181220 [Cryptomeria japonica]|nr:hypothetical protein SUGI_1181220 [Cryptomeria japonica]
MTGDTHLGGMMVVDSMGISLFMLQEENIICGATLPEEKWPCLFSYNWHPISEKMSKSIGNFKNLRQAKGVFLFDAEQAQIVEAAGAIAVVMTEETPMRPGAEVAAIGITRLTDLGVVRGIEKSVNILVISRARIGHFAEAQILEAIDVDFIDESEIVSQEMTKVIARTPVLVLGNHKLMTSSSDKRQWTMTSGNDVFRGKSINSWGIIHFLEKPNDHNELVQNFINEMVKSFNMVGIYIKANNGVVVNGTVLAYGVKCHGLNG